MNFQKFQIKLKILKHFTSPRQRSSWKKLFSLRGTKAFERGFTGIYRQLLSKCFENAVLGRLEMVQYKCFFWLQPETCFFNKCNKIIGMMKKLSPSVSRQSLLTIYKSFFRTILDYADIIYDKPYKGSFIEEIERVQYNACLVITGALKVLRESVSIKN